MCIHTYLAYGQLQILSIDLPSVHYRITIIIQGTLPPRSDALEIYEHEKDLFGADPGSSYIGMLELSSCHLYQLVFIYEIVV